MRKQFGLGVCACLIASMFLLPVTFGPSAYGHPQLLALFVAIAIMFHQQFAANTGTSVQVRLIWLVPVLMYGVFHAGLVESSLTTALTFFLMLLIGVLISAGPTSQFAVLLATGILLTSIINVLIGFIQFTNTHTAFYPFVANPVFKDIQYIFGNVRQANLFSTLMCLGIASVWYFASVGKLANRYAIPIIVGLVVGVVLSASRTGALIIITFAALHAFWRYKATVSVNKLLANVYLFLPILYAVTWFLIVNVAPAIGLYLRAGLDKGSNVTNPSRLTLYQNAIELIGQAPFFGHGIGESGFAYFMHDFGKNRHNEILDNAHNIVLHAGVELGIVGALLLFVPFVVGVVRSKPWAAIDADRQMAWMIILALCVHSMLEYPLQNGNFWLVFCLACCIVFAGVRLQLLASGLRVILLGAAVIFTALLGYLIWDYDRVSQPFAGPHQRYAPNDPTPYLEAQKSVVFREYGRFSLLAIVDVTPESAEQLIPELKRALHYSSEGRITLRLIEALILTGRTQEALYYATRFNKAYPGDFKQYLGATEAKYKDVLVKVK